jgi:hypothetical protein
MKLLAAADWWTLDNRMPGFIRRGAELLARK